MEDTTERIVRMRIDNNGVTLFTSKGVAGPYDVSAFLCEIYEKLCLHYESNQPQHEFFNFEDPRGAWELLSDFFKRTNFLQNVSLQDFEEYRSKYEIALEYKKGEHSSFYHAARTPSVAAAFICFSKELDPFRKFDKDALDQSDFDPDVFFYDSCRTMIDFVFSLVHYLIFNGYKIRKCAHCGKLFATKSLKCEYCTFRFSPFPGYEKYTCQVAVKKIKDALEKRRRTEYERLRHRAAMYDKIDGENCMRDGKHSKAQNEFVKTCDDYKDKLKKGASVELLKEYKAFLYYSENVRRKYERSR